MSTHRFGGAWTERKLSALGHYLVQYQVIFKKNPAARKLRTVYVDAFAGTGDRDARQDKTTVSLFGYGDETREFQLGSARVALGLENKFDHYVSCTGQRAASSSHPIAVRAHRSSVSATAGLLP